MSKSGDITLNYNKLYKNIERPYANVDLSKIPSWDLVMSIMEQQALVARQQMMARYQENQVHVPKTINNLEYHHHHHQNSPYTYNNNSSPRIDENSSYFSDEMDSSSPEPSTSSCSSDADSSQSESDIEIDVDSIEENDDYFVPSLDNIPLTVLQLETQLREKELHRVSS